MSALLLTVVSLFAIYFAIKFTEWMKDRQRLIEAIEKLPGPPNFPILPLINHAITIVYIDFLKHPYGTFTLAYQAMLNMNRIYPEEGLVRIWMATKPVVILYSPETIESVLLSTTVINKADEYRFFEPWIGEGLVTSKAAKWRVRRKILTPAFHFRILGDFLPIMNQEATRLIEKLNNVKYLDKDKPFDITPLIALCTLDTICETAMGLNINCQADEQSPYVRALHEVAEQALNRVIRPWLWTDTLFYLTESGKKFVKARDVMHQFTTKVILERKSEWEQQLLLDRSASKQGMSHNDESSGKQATREGSAMSLEELRSSAFFTSGNKRLAFLDLMLHQHLIEKTMSIEDIREEVETFMFAGHDTTAMAISWVLYMLGLQQDIQDRVRAELDEVMRSGDDRSEFYSNSDNKIKHQNKIQDEENCGGGGGETGREHPLAKELKTTDVTNEQIREMKYLDRVIKETLRMWPSIPFVARQMTEDLLVDRKYLIPRGATCVLFTQALHNNPRYYPKPEIFDPDRFLPENSAGRHPFAYLPFSAGPRNCIGQKFAQMEVKVILAKVLRNYFVKTHDHIDKLAIVGELVLRSRNGLSVSLAPRFM